MGDEQDRRPRARDGRGESSSRNSSRWRGSSPAVGSSRSQISASCARARARKTRRRSPPERADASRSASASTSQARIASSGERRSSGESAEKSARVGRAPLQDEIEAADREHEVHALRHVGDAAGGLPPRQPREGTPFEQELSRAAPRRSGRRPSGTWICPSRSRPGSRRSRPRRDAASSPGSAGGPAVSGVEAAGFEQAVVTALAGAARRRAARRGRP